MSQDPNEPTPPTDDAEVQDQEQDETTDDGFPEELREELPEDTELDAIVVVDDRTGPSPWARLGAEAFGTLFLVLAGTTLAIGLLGSNPLATALAFGIAVMVGVAVFGQVSGAHFNPAVTLGLAFAGRIAWKDVLPYWLAQLVGGAAGAGVLFLVLGTWPALTESYGTTARALISYASNGFGDHSPLATPASGVSGFTLAGALVIEVVVTAIFVTVVLAATRPAAKRSLAPATIGLALAVLILVAMPVTNGSLNPARSTATAIFSESWALGQLWVFWVAPLVGAAVVGLLYRAFVAPAEVIDLDLVEEEILLENTAD